MDYRTTYMEILLSVVMNIQEGESLSINTNPGHLDFARDLAQIASETTLQPVHIVPIEEGSPGEVITVSPIEHEQSPLPPLRAALLRLDDTEDRDWDFSADPQQIAQDFALLQKVGNLAPPQLDRQVAPWSIAAVPGPVWARRLLGNHATEQQLWDVLAPVFKIEDKDPQHAWREHISLLDSRLANLNRLEVETFEIRNETGTRLTLAPVLESRWRGGVRKLENGRAFVPHLPLDRVSMLVDRSTTTGILRTTKPFPLLGGMVEGAVLEFSQGRIVSFDAASGKELLKIALGMDEGASRMGECSLVEKGSALTHIADVFGYAGFDENHTSTITLGMGEAFHLEALDTYSDELELQEQTGCNVSNLRVRLPIGDDNLSFTARLIDGDEIIIMHNGQFLI